MELFSVSFKLRNNVQRLDNVLHISFSFNQVLQQQQQLNEIESLQFSFNCILNKLT